MKRRLDSRLAMCMLLRRTWGDRNVSPCVLKCRIACGFPDDLIVNIQHCGFAFLSVLWQGTLDVSIFYKFKSALVQIRDGGVHRHSWHATWCLLEASIIETHNRHIPYSHWHAARVWQSSWWRRRLAQAPADWEFMQARLRRLFHLRSASAQDPHEFEGLPLVRRRSACCSQPEGHHGTNNACTWMSVVNHGNLTVMQTGTHILVLLFVVPARCSCWQANCLG